MTDRILHIDYETRSTCDLKEFGLQRYCEHETTDIWCAAYSFDDGPIEVWTPAEIIPLDVAAHIEAKLEVVAHNAFFEVNITNHVLAKKYGWPRLDIKQMTCTMVAAYEMGLPGSLEKCAPALGLDIQKDKEGSRIMLQMAAPKRFRGKIKEVRDARIVWWDEYLPRLIEYCKQDVRVEQELYKRLSKLNTIEKHLWFMDFEINKRGVLIDAEAAKRAVFIVELEKDRLNTEIRKLSNKAIASTDAIGDIAAYLRSNRVPCEGVNKSEVARILRIQNLPVALRRILEIRQEAAKSSTAKLKTMINTVSLNDNRARWLYQFYGAHTGRWASRRIQVHNLPRPDISQNSIDYIFEQLQDYSKFPQEVADSIRLFNGSVLGAISSSIRGFLMARPQFHFVGMDWNAIEARALAWIAGEEPVLNIFRSNGKIYEVMAAAIYRVPIEKVTQKQRLVGKVAVLALGYGGGKNAFQKMAVGYNVQVTLEEAEIIKLAWRAANPAIVKFWADLEIAAKKAINNPGTEYVVRTKYTKIKYKVSGSFLLCTLPSGRNLCYPYPKILDVETPWGEMKPSVTYKTEEPPSREWKRVNTYGGSLCENVVQAIARDILAAAMMKLEQAGIPINIHVHDEIVVEIPDDADMMSFLKYIMETPPAWAKELPLDWSHWEGKRFQK